ncbi:hypothetical protein AGMMS49587_04860 [Spirochaetia bacterium]|nr:hypothetical protein AGMMS49587_04860 [Spirochaetia bacterium]
MNQNLLAAIKQLIAEQGETILADTKRVNAYLSDMATKEPKPQRMAFVKCLMYGFQAELKNTSPDERVRCKNRLAQKLFDEEGIDATLAKDTLDLLEAVLFGTVSASPEPESIPSPAVPTPPLIEGLSSAWFFPPGITYSSEKMDGKFQLTQHSIKFVPSRFWSIGAYGKNDTVEIELSAIVSVQKAKSLLPTIEIQANSGHILKISGYGKVNEVFELLREKLGAK